MRRGRKRCWIWTAALAVGCGAGGAGGAGGGGGGGGADAPAPEEAVSPPQPSEASLPPGQGTLRQDAFTVTLRQAELQIKATPLHESVIRLAAPDTYDRLRDFAAMNREWVRELGRRAGLRDEPLLFLVSFHTFAPRSEYTPTDLQILSQGRRYRPLDFRPVTPGFGTQLLRQEETQIAVYAFDPGIDLSVPMTVQYRTSSSEAWERIISILEAERARVLSRTKAEGTG